MELEEENSLNCQKYWNMLVLYSGMCMFWFYNLVFLVNSLVF